MPRAKENIHVKSLLILAMCLLYILHNFTHSNIFDYFLTAFTIVVFLSNLKQAEPLPRYFSICMFMLGFFINIYKGAVIEGTVKGILSYLPLLSLIILVPLLTIPIKLGGYYHSIQFFVEKLAHQLRKLFVSISILLFCLGPVLNIGTIRILHELIGSFKLAPEILAKSYLVGFWFSSVILWSPYYASVALVLYQLKVPILHYIPLGFTLAIIQLVTGNLLFWIWLKRRKDSDVIARFVTSSDEQNINVQQGKKHQKNMLNLAGLFSLIIGMTFLLEFLTKWSMLFLVSLVSITFPVLWAVTKGKWSDFTGQFIIFKNTSVVNMKNEIVLFISAGLFSKALTGTAAADSIKLFLAHTASISFLLFILFVAGTILVLTFIGVHQLVVVSALVTQMDANMLGTRPEVLALLLMLSWSLSSVLSPINPINLLVSRLLGKSSLSVGLRWNGVFLLTMLIIGSTFVYLIH
ncbi:hypothetical protein [Neobacillus rhizophilus]|uniref:Uncharacterized protein n=1 Tax=Neobacillus rhizophilus TaxID=2833579 RepID=A0A942UB45_9BACI|nr:hypothetical protein [Neobacillus rhizophilus]MBS4214909.1 hypothetical protein [Neobacillus rhizophilus]